MRTAARPWAALGCALAMLLGTLAGSLGALAALAPPAAAASSFQFHRVAGADAPGTAAQIATATFPNGASTVLLARDDYYPDALAGNFLAGNLGAPILLTQPAGPVPSETLTALQTLGAKDVIILGGTEAVSQAQQEALTGLGYSVTRIAGNDRFGTMEAVAEASGTTVGTDPKGERTAILVTGSNFRDALSAGPLSYAEHLPIVLTAGGSPTLSPEAVSTLATLKIQHVLIVGGTAAVTAQAAAQLDSGATLAPLQITVARDAGADGPATAEVLAQDEVANWGFSTTGFGLARGDWFPDALVAGSEAGLAKQPILLTPDPYETGPSATYAQAHAATLTSGTAFGGVCALADSTLDALVQIIGGTLPAASAPCPGSLPPEPGSPYKATTTGWDISWPQCNHAYPPAGSPIGIVGVNDGHAFSINPCLAAEAAWAGPGRSYYINVNAPFANWDSNIDNHLYQGPKASCAHQQLPCAFYDYGYNAAISSMADVPYANAPAAGMWWLDVEDPSGLWATDTTANAALIQGAVDALRQAGHTVAVYSTSYQWGQIAGSFRPGVPQWVPTGQAQPPDMPTWCDPATKGFTGGPIWAVQYWPYLNPSGPNFDADQAC